MEKILNEILGQINTLAADVKSMKTEMETMQNEMKEMKGEIKGIKGEVEIVNGKLDEHHDLLDALEHRVEENTAQLTAVSENVNYIKGDLGRLNKRLDHQLFEIAKTNEEIYLLKTGS